MRLATALWLHDLYSFTNSSQLSWAAQHPRQSPMLPKLPPHELVEENVDCLGRWFLEHFGHTVCHTPHPTTKDEPSASPHPPTARRTSPLKYRFSCTCTCIWSFKCYFYMYLDPKYLKNTNYIQVQTSRLYLIKSYILLYYI